MFVHYRYEKERFSLVFKKIIPYVNVDYCEVDTPITDSVTPKAIPSDKIVIDLEKLGVLKGKELGDETDGCVLKENDLMVVIIKLVINMDILCNFTVSLNRMQLIHPFLLFYYCISNKITK